MELISVFEYSGWSIRYSLSHIKDADPQKPTKTAVFVHGTPWSSAVYKPVIEALQARGSINILTYDLPGYGQSQSYAPTEEDSCSAAGFEGDTSVGFQARTLSALLQHLQLDGKNGNLVPAVVAHDIAGAIVLRAHLIHGCEFSTMMLMDTNAVLPWGDGFYRLVRSEPETFQKLPSSIFEATVRAVIRSACYDPNVLQSGWEDVLAMPWIGGVGAGGEADQRQRSFVRQIAQANDKDVAEMLEGDSYARVRCDAKVLWGENDTWIPKERIEELVARMKGRVKEKVFVPKAGHLVMLDQPARVAVEIYDWLIRAEGP